MRKEALIRSEVE